MRKGQAALEYLLTYGWAILIVIIVGASLYALGVFTPGQWTGKRQTGFAQFRVEDFKLDTNGVLTIIFQNQIGKAVELTDIKATYKGIECVFSTAGGKIYEKSSSGWGTGTNITSSGYTISPSKLYKVNATCSNWSNPSLKSSYSITTDFYYIDPDSGLSHIDSGTLFGAVEQ